MRLLPLAGLLLATSAAFGQDMPVFEPSMSWPEVATINQFGLLASQAVKGTPGRRDGGAAASPRGAALAFAPSAERRRANYAQFVARSRRADPAGADNLAATLASDPIAQMGPELAKVGLHTNDVADAYAVYWVEAWEAAHGAAGDNSREQAQAVRRQAAAAILAVPAFGRATDAQKQELADALLVQALLLGATKEQAGGDPARLRQIGDAARRGARAMGLDLDAMTLTERGFVPSAGPGR